MNRNCSRLALLTILALAACSTDVVVSPLKVPAGPKFALSSTSGVGNYIVLLKGNGIPKGFKENVLSAGGEVTWSHAGAGLATVSGLTNEAAAELASTDGVAEVQPDIQIGLDTPLAAAEADASDIGEPSISSAADPTTAARYTWQWNMTAIGANTAWAAGKLGSSGVTVAILDTGLDYNIPDLNGLVDLTRSTSFVAGDNAIRSAYFPTRNDITDFNGHGTNVASQVSSKAVVLAGVTSQTTLIGVKVLGYNGSGSSSGVIKGVLWAADHGANIANMSLGALGGGSPKAGGGGFVSGINRVFNYAKQKGMLIVVSAGNDGIDLQHNGNMYVTYCDAPHVVCVSSVGAATALLDQDEPAYYTNFGNQALTVAAPGGNADAAHGFPASARPWGNDIASWVWSYCPKDKIGGFTGTGVPILTACAGGNRITGYIGTSQAAPHVAGLAASLMAEFGTGNPAQIKHLIEKSAVLLTPAAPEFGRGLISVAKAFSL